MDQDQVSPDTELAVVADTASEAVEVADIALEVVAVDIALEVAADTAAVHIQFVQVEPVHMLVEVVELVHKHLVVGVEDRNNCSLDQIINLQF